MNQIYNVAEDHKQFFRNNEAIFIFVTFIIGRKSPHYEDTLINKEHWDIQRDPVHNSEDLLAIMYDLYNKSKEDPNFALSERDKACFSAKSFLKTVYFASKSVFSNLLCEINLSNEEFMNNSCEEITKYIDDIDTRDEFDEKLFTACEELLKIEDEFQLHRFEKLLGLPLVNMNEPFYRSLPVIGKANNTIKDEEIYKITTTYRSHETASFVQKLLDLRYKKSMRTKIVIAIMKACLTNPKLFQYVWLLPYKNEEHANYFDFVFFDEILDVRGHRFTTAETIALLKDLYEQLSAKIANGFLLQQSIPNFQGFIGNYKNGSIASETYSIVKEFPELIVYKIEFKCTVKPNVYENKIFVAPSECQEVEESGQNVVRIKVEERPNHDTEISEAIREHCKDGSKMEYFDPDYISTPTYTTFVKYMAMKKNYENYELAFKFKPGPSMINSPTEFNEYVPRSTFNVTVGYGFEEIVTLFKLNPYAPWKHASDIDCEVSFSKKVVKAQNYATNHYMQIGQY